ncbi:MAG: DegV family protein [Anaerolineales bacterium]|nr:DegV family protein [Anaerolineales bacterium]
MLRIASDSTADMPAGWQKEYDIDIIPINIQFGEKTYLQGIDLDTEGFYRMVDETRTIPKTSQPTPYQFKEFYQKIAKKGDTILSIHITSKLSGTYDSAVAAARELGTKMKIITFDSLSGSAGLGMMCREARLMDRAGAGVDKIVKRMEAIRDTLSIVLALDTLEYARMSGRVKALQAALASLLNVKPIAVLQDGVLHMAEKVRTRRASLDRVIEMLVEKYKDKKVNVAVVHARDPQAGNSMLEQVRQRFNIKDLIMTDLSVSLTANLGPGTVGLIVYPAE